MEMSQTSAGPVPSRGAIGRHLIQGVVLIAHAMCCAHAQGLLLIGSELGVLLVLEAKS